MKPQGYIPDQADLDYIERAASPVHPVLAEIEEAARPKEIPILDRESGRVLAVLANGRRRILEVGTGYGYSTLWMALAQGAPGRIATIDVDPERVALAREWWREAGIADARIATVVRPALEALAAGDAPELEGPFDLVFLDAVKEEFPDLLEAVIPLLAENGLIVADNALRHGLVAAGDRDPRAEGTRAFNAALLCDRRFWATILPVGDGLAIAALRPSGSWLP